MGFFELCIRRPVLATVLSLIVLLLGLISYGRLSVREYPRIDEPVVSVTTIYRGASAEVVESQVTKPLEDSLAGIEGVEIMTSSSRSERSQINVRFTLKRDPDSAAADVRDKVARARGKRLECVRRVFLVQVIQPARPRQAFCLLLRIPLGRPSGVRMPRQEDSAPAVLTALSGPVDALEG